MNRRQRRVAASKWTQAAGKGGISGIESMGVSPLTEGQLAIFNESGRISRHLYVGLLWSLRGAWDELVEEGKAPESPKPRLYSLGGGGEEQPTWRFAEFTNAHDMIRAKGVAVREAGAVAFVFGAQLDAPDGVSGYALTLEHTGFIGVLERHHWCAEHGWRVFDGQVVQGPIRIEWTQRADDAIDLVVGPEEA